VDRNLTKERLVIFDSMNYIKVSYRDLAGALIGNLRRAIATKFTASHELCRRLIAW
jgi:hypothetical protein